MKRFQFGLLALAGAGVATLGLSAAQAEPANHHGRSHHAQASHHRPHYAKRYYGRVYAEDPYYYGGYEGGPRPVYVYIGRRGVFDFPPDAPGGLFNGEPRPVEQNPQQYIMNQLHDRPFSDDEPY